MLTVEECRDYLPAELPDNEAKKLIILLYEFWQSEIQAYHNEKGYS